MKSNGFEQLFNQEDGRFSTLKSREGVDPLMRWIIVCRLCVHSVQCLYTVYTVCTLCTVLLIDTILTRGVYTVYGLWAGAHCVQCVYSIVD